MSRGVVVTGVRTAYDADVRTVRRALRELSERTESPADRQTLRVTRMLLASLLGSLRTEITRTADRERWYVKPR